MYYFISQFVLLLLLLVVVVISIFYFLPLFGCIVFRVIIRITYATLKFTNKNESGNFKDSLVLTRSKEGPSPAVA